MSGISLQSLADERDVRAVLEEYCLRMEVNEFEEWMDLFTEDTVYEVYKLTLKGKTEVADLLCKAPHGIHIGGATRIELDGDRAETVQNYLFISTSTDEWNAGWYHRVLLRTAEGWKISHTKVKFGRKGALEADERAGKLTFPIGFS